MLLQYMGEFQLPAVQGESIRIKLATRGMQLLISFVTFLACEDTPEILQRLQRT